MQVNSSFNSAMQACGTDAPCAIHPSRAQRPISASRLPTALINYSVFLPLAVVGIGMFSSTAARAAEVEAALLLDHVSNLLHGWPFDDRPELQQDYFAPLAMTITAGKAKAWEIDLSHGVKRFERGETEQGSGLAVRFYPGRLRRVKK